MQEFLSFNFSLRECFFCTSPAPPPPPISFLMARPLWQFLIIFGTVGMLNAHHLSMGGIRRGYRFLEKWYIIVKGCAIGRNLPDGV